MRKLILGVIICMLLTGCSQSMQVENQAYVLILGVDLEDDGSITFSAQMPKISQSAQSEDGASGGSYLKSSANAADYADALQKLSETIPRTLNLSQLKMLVLSRKLAESERCRQMLSDIAQTKRLFAAARVVVCDGRADEYVNSTEAVMGDRLSTDLTAMMDHSIEIGLIPDEKLADIYDLMMSIYSDPMAIHAADGTDKFTGAVLFSSGRMSGVLDSRESVFADLLHGSTRSFKYKYNSRNLDISPVRPTRVQISTDSSPVRIDIDISLSVNAQESEVDISTLEHMLEDDLADVIRKAQQLITEPFGFANIAAKNFMTDADFIAYDWKRHYSDAQVQIKVHAALANA